MPARVFGGALLAAIVAVTGPAWPQSPMTPVRPLSPQWVEPPAAAKDEASKSEAGPREPEAAEAARPRSPPRAASRGSVASRLNRQELGRIRSGAPSSYYPGYYSGYGYRYGPAPYSSSD